MNTHVLRSLCISFCTIIPALLFFCVPQSAAQMRTLAFSAVDMNMKDGFNNGNVILPPTANIPLTIGIFDSFTGLLSPLGVPDMLLVRVLDAAGNPHPGLSVIGGVLPVDSGTAVTTASLSLRWSGTGGTVATVVVRDTRALAVPASLIVVFEPAAPQNLHVTALVIHDVNRNGVHDAPDVRITTCTVVACPPDVTLATTADQEYVLDIPQYTGPFPLFLYNMGCPGWRQTVPEKGTGRMVNSYTDTIVFFMEPAGMALPFSGIRHDFFGQATGTVEDSLLVLYTLADDSPVSVAVRAAEWRMTGLLEPGAGATASFSMTVYGTGTSCPGFRQGRLSVLCADGMETVTPAFSDGSDTYTMNIYRNGQLVYTEANRSGAAVIVPQAVRRWGARNGILTMSELLPRPIQIAGGAIVTGDLVTLAPSSGTAGAGVLTEVVLGGSGLGAVTLYGHDIGVAGMQATCTGSAMFRGQQGGASGLHVEGGSSGGVLLAPDEPAQSIGVHWGQPVLPAVDVQPVFSFEAFCAGEACPLGEIALFRDTDDMFSCRTSSTSYGNGERTVHVFNDGVAVASVTTTQDLVAQYSQFPAGCRATTQYGGAGYTLSWDGSVALKLPDGRQVSGDQVRVSFHGDGPVRELGGMMMKPRNKWIIDIDDIDNDTLPAITLTATITITGQVFDDKNGDGVWQYITAPEPGRAGRKVYLYGEDAGEIDSVLTDFSGAYSITFDTLVCGWAPVYVNLHPVAGWQRTNGDYDMVLHNTVNQSLSGIDFGEKCIPEDKFETAMLTYGIDDMFETGVAESASPSLMLLDRMAACRHTATEYFDTFAPDRWFVHTLPCRNTDGCVVQEAELTMRLRAGMASPHNDVITLRHGGQVLWSSSVAELTGDQTWYPGKTATLQLDLTALPSGTGSPVGLLPALQNGELDVLLSDDTGIDYLTYTTGLACKEPQADEISTGVAGGDGVSFAIQVSPNPNAGTGVIEFGPVQSAVTLVITDIMQREVARLLNAEVPGAGRYTVRFSLPALPSGTYFVQLWDGATVRTYPFLLAR